MGLFWFSDVPYPDYLHCFYRARNANGLTRCSLRIGLSASINWLYWRFVTTTRDSKMTKACVKISFDMLRCHWRFVEVVFCLHPMPSMCRQNYVMARYLTKRSENYQNVPCGVWSLTHVVLVYCDFIVYWLSRFHGLCVVVLHQIYKRYTLQVVDGGLLNQVNNSEVNVNFNRRSSVVAQQELHLRIIISKLTSAHKGLDVEWRDTGKNERTRTIDYWRWKT